MDAMWLATTLIAGLCGAALGAFIAWRIQARLAQARHVRLVASAREQIAASIQSQRALNTRLQAELERERANNQRKLLAASADDRASIARLEGQLRFAYAEIDRLNANAKAQGITLPDTETDGNGFALTRPLAR